MNISSLLPRIGNIWDHIVASPFIHLVWKSAGVTFGKTPRFYGFPILHMAKESKITIGNHFVARSRPSSNSIGTIQPVVITTTTSDAIIHIGDDVRISGCTLHCRKKIVLGNRVGLGSGCLIMDNDAHPLNPNERHSQTSHIRSSGIMIEEDVWIGGRAIILKGTQIGARTIVQAGSVVSGTFPPDCIIGGNPATILNRYTAADHSK